MNRTVATVGAACQSATGDSTVDMSRALACLRTSVQECGYTHEALAAVMGCCPSMVTKVLNGDKPLKEEWICALPDDVERAYLAKRAESLGALVVQPLRGVDAQKAFVSGLLGLLGATAPDFTKVIG